MTVFEQFRNPQVSQQLVEQIQQLAQSAMRTRKTPLQIMEVCGGHTHTLFRYGIDQLFDGLIEFVHGPGCPVCVLPPEVIDHCVALAFQNNVIFTTFGDAIRVPGRGSPTLNKQGLSLQQARANGANVKVVYSPLDALELAKQHPDKEVVFFALGFDTTMPSTALTVLQAQTEQISNFSLYGVHIQIIPTLKTVLADPDVQLDGLIGPGHVSMVIGSKPYQFIAKQHRLPFVISGFEPIDILQSLKMILQQIQQSTAAVVNQYSRTVVTNGNANALRAMGKVFESKEQSYWQGLGLQPDVGVGIRCEFKQFDAEHKFADLFRPLQHSQQQLLPYCDKVIMGKMSPNQCPKFGVECNPQHPLGALMVSSEGACAAWHAYREVQKG